MVAGGLCILYTLLMQFGIDELLPTKGALRQGVIFDLAERLQPSEARDPRAASVTELASALDRPKSTVAHHVAVLVRADLLRVVSTRRVRAVEERLYGRTARLFYVAPQGSSGEEMPAARNCGRK
mgnify:CR=1 FL=1